MAVSKSVDIPGATTSYAAQVIQSQQPVDKTQNFIPVPGPQGPQGPKGDRGEKGDTGQKGEKGEKGDPGQNGKNGHNGQDGLSSLSSSGQQAGWAEYFNVYDREILTGATRGDDGWVDMAIKTDPSNDIEKFLPNGCVSFWNPNSYRLNFKGLKEGSHVFIKYKFDITTYSSNTEVWVRTQFPGSDLELVNFASHLKYQSSYSLNVTQDFFVSDKKIWASAALPQIRTDFDASVFIKSIAISVI